MPEAGDMSISRELRGRRPRSVPAGARRNRTPSGIDAGHPQGPTHSAGCFVRQLSTRSPAGEPGRSSAPMKPGTRITACSRSLLIIEGGVSPTSTVPRSVRGHEIPASTVRSVVRRSRHPSRTRRSTSRRRATTTRLSRPVDRFSTGRAAARYPLRAIPPARRRHQHIHRPFGWDRPSQYTNRSRTSGSSGRVFPDRAELTASGFDLGPLATPRPRKPALGGWPGCTPAAIRDLRQDGARAESRSHLTVQNDLRPPADGRQTVGVGRPAFPEPRGSL